MAPFKSGKGRNLGKLVKGYKSSNIGQGLGSGGSSTPVGFTATGGTEYTLADPDSPTGYYKYHAFTNPGILTTTAGANTAESLDFLAIGGGGGGGYINPRSPSPYQAAGGGGAGGLITHDQSTIVIATGTYTVAIGTAGLGSPDTTPGHPGSSGGDTTITPPSSPTTYVYRAFGGGGGGGGPSSLNREGLPGGSGGGGGSPTIVTNTTETNGGTGIPGQGYAGRPGSSVKGYSPPSGENGRTAGGGGGAGGQGSNPGSERFFGPSPTDTPYQVGGTGGPAATNPVFTSPKLPASGLPGGQITVVGPTGLYGAGGGGSSVSNPVSLGGLGGAGGGGNGSSSSSYPSPVQSATPAAFQARIAPGPYPSGPPAALLDATGVGCGGGGSHSPGYGGGAGTKGFLILRYETPAPS